MFFKGTKSSPAGFNFLFRFVSDAQVRQVDAPDWTTGSWKQQKDSCEVAVSTQIKTITGKKFKYRRKNNDDYNSNKNGQISLADTTHSMAAVVIRIGETKPRYCSCESGT